MKTIPSLRWPLFTLALAGFMFGAIPARGGSYYKQKSFEFEPKATLGISVRGITYCHAFTSDLPQSGPECTDFEVQPATQPDGWRALEHDILAGYGSTTVMNRGTNADGTSSFLVANTNYTSFGGLAETVDFEAVADDCPSYALAHSQIDMDTFLGSTRITGTATVYGTNEVVKVRRKHKAYAFSTAMVEAQGTNMVKGVVTAGPVYRIKIRGTKGHDGRNGIQDPVTFRINDPVTGTVVTGEFLRFILEGLPGAGGEASWESNVMHMATSDCSFRLELPGVYTTEKGRIQMEVRGGVLLKAESEGVYAGILPPVGTSVPFALPLPNMVRMTYDLTGIADTNEVAIELSAGGYVLEEYEVDEPALAVTTSPHAVTLTWPVSATEFELQHSPTMTPAPIWANTDLKPSVDQGLATVTVPPDADHRFFRLFAEESGPCGLVFVSQPEDALVEAGTVVSLGVEASGAPEPVSFQWQRLDPELGFVDIPEANSPLLTWTVSPADDNVQFRCNISNGCSAVTSLPARVILVTAN